MAAVSRRRARSPRRPAPGQPVDVEAALTARQQAKGNPELNWKSSIVDLMKLLDLDSSLDNRKALATELGYTGALGRQRRDEHLAAPPGDGGAGAERRARPRLAGGLGAGPNPCYIPAIAGFHPLREHAGG